MGDRTYLHSVSPGVRRLGRQWFDDDYDDDSDVEPAPRQVPAARQENALGLPFTLTWERVLLIAALVYLVWRMIKGMGKTAKRLKRIERRVRSIEGSSNTIIIDADE